MGLQDETVVGLQTPGTAVTISHFNKIDWPIVFVCPAGVLHLLSGRVDQHKAARPQQRLHAVILQPDIAVMIAWLVSEQGPL